MEKYMYLLFSLFGSIPMLNAQCFPDRHNTNLSSSFISCQKEQSPNPDRDAGIWLSYQLEETKTIKSIKLWNVNHPDYLTDGVRALAVDYVLADGTWQRHSTHDIPMAEGSGFYEGVELDLQDEFVTDQILITLEDNYGSGNCIGIAEIRIGATEATSTSTDELALDHFDMQIEPNPFDQKSNITLHNLDGSRVQYFVINSIGQIVRSGVTSNQSGIANFEIIGEGLASGQYFLKIIDGKRVSTGRLIRQSK